MARVNAADVKELIKTELDDGVIVSSMIEVANAYVDEHLSAAGHSARILRAIELYLAAHFVAIAEERGGLIRDRYGDASVAFADQFGDGLRATRFGQQALVLDTSGILASLGATQQRAEFRVV